MKRRDFIRKLVGVLSAIWGIGFFIGLFSYINPQQKEKKWKEKVLSGGKLKDLRLKEGKFLPRPENPLWIIRAGEKEVIALSAVCTHLKCIVEWNGEKESFICPCHAGIFDINGNVISGPPPRPLPRYPVDVRGGEIYVGL